MDLYVLNYNNYYNRIVKRETELSSYLPYQVSVIYRVNYAPSNGVFMTQVLNSEVTGNYAIYVEGNEIVSRWFIIESGRNCKNQYTLSLRRDLIADNYDTVVNADTFIEKAILQDSDPLIYNSEDMTTNEILTSAYPLIDDSGLGLIVGYCDKSSVTDTVAVEAENIEPYATLKAFETDWGAQSYIVDNYVADFLVYAKWQWYNDVYYNINLTIKTYDSMDSNDSPLYAKGTDAGSIGKAISSTLEADYSLDTLRSSLALDYAGGVNGRVIKTPPTEYNGKIVQDTTNSKYYRINILSKRETFTYSVPGSGNVFSSMKAITDQATWQGTPNNKTYVVNITGDVYYYTKTEVEVASTTYKISTDRTHLNNEYYDMFAIPFYKGSNSVARIEYTNSEGSKVTVYDTALTYERAKAVANSLQIQSNFKLYDIQILPFFPMQDLITSYNCVSLPNYKYVTEVKSSEGSVKHLIIWCDTNEFEATLTTSGISPLTDNIKIANQCDKVRIVSPNKQSTFEFNYAKNGGLSKYMNIKGSYKPYQPSILVQPQFAGLYKQGQYYGNLSTDPRGLLFSGDYSMTQASDSWAEYKRNNVNYQNAFDREIQNIEITNKYQNQKDLISGITSAIGTGAGVGALVGGKLGVGVGLLTAGLSGAGLSQDMYFTRKMQSEALDYKQDMFGYQLGNIKALPTTINKVDSMSPVFSVWPQIELYTCTDAEKQAVANKIAYNSMSVGKIGKIKDYIQNKWSYGDITSKGYIKGQLIRIEVGDTNYANELANEINKGAYFN